MESTFMAENAFVDDSYLIASEEIVDLQEPYCSMALRNKVDQNSSRRKTKSKIVTKVLELYEQYPCLWDVNHPCYRNRSARACAYQQMGQLMKASGPIAKQKIKALQDIYSLEQKKVERSKRFALRPGDVYVSQLPWISNADRLFGGFYRKKTSDSFLNRQCDERNDESAKLPEKFVLNGHDTTPQTSTEVLSEESQTTAPKNPDQPAKSIDRVEVELVEAAADVNNVKKDEDDEFDVFAKSVSCHLKRLPMPVALKCQSFIQSYLIEHRLKAHSQVSEGANSSQTSINSCQTSQTSIGNNDVVEEDHIPLTTFFDDSKEEYIVDKWNDLL